MAIVESNVKHRARSLCSWLLPKYICVVWTSTGIRAHVTANIWVRRPVLKRLHHKSTVAARQTESDLALTTLLLPFYFWVAPSLPWTHTQLTRGCHWWDPAMIHSWVSPTWKLQIGIMQHNQFVVSTGTFWHHLLCESSLGFELAANVWVSHPVLNPLCNKWTPAARQTESDPALTTLLPPFYFWVAPSPPSPTMYKHPWGGPPAMRLFWWQMSRQSKYLAVVTPRLVHRLEQGHGY